MKDAPKTHAKHHSLFTDMPQPAKRLGDLFDLYQERDGSFRAEFGAATAPLSLLLAWKIDTQERDLVAALFLIADSNIRKLNPNEVEVPAPIGPSLFVRSNSGDVISAVSRLKGLAALFHIIVSRFGDAMGADLQTLVDPANQNLERDKARRSLIRRFTTAVEALHRRGRGKPHRATAAVTYNAADGLPRTMPLAWAILEIAREMVQEKQELPSKRSLRIRVESRFPEREYSTAQWAASFKEAGLASLERADNW